MSFTNSSPRSRVPMRRSLLAVFLGLTTFGCSKYADMPEAKVVSTSTTAASIGLRCVTGTEMSGRRWFALELSSTGPETLTDCHLTLNGSYSSPLAKVIVAETLSTRPHGRATLEPGDSLRIVGSHDVSNHSRFRDDEDAPFTRDETLKTIQLSSSQGEISWEVPD